jgi:hypothetical protein
MMKVKNNDDTRDCPYCKEEIKAEAVKCKHCHSKVALAHPEHNGTCPFCKEDVKPDAVKCKHCGSQIAGEISEVSQSCNCGQPPVNQVSTSALRINRNNNGYTGNDCYEDCRNFIENLGGTPIYSHMMCQDACQISIPFPNVYLRY